MSKLNLTMIFTMFISKPNQSLETHILVVLQLQAQKRRKSLQTKMLKETLKCTTCLAHQSKRLQRQHLPLYHSNTQYQTNLQVRRANPPQHLSSPPSPAVKLSKNA
jgi:hypothetical protein